MDRETKQLTKRRNIDSHTSSRSAGKEGADHIKTHSAYKVLAKVVSLFNPHNFLLTLPPHTHPHHQLLHPGTAGTQPPNHSCCSQPL